MERKSKYDGKFAAGQRFGAWTVVDGSIHGSPAKIEVKCDCGNSKMVDVYTLTKGRSTSCGCARVGENAPNWRGISGVSKTILNAVSGSYNVTTLATAYNSQSGRCILSNQELTADNATVTTLTSTTGVSNTYWVSKDMMPLIEMSNNHIPTIRTIATTVVKNTNIFDTLGMTQRKE